MLSRSSSGRLQPLKLAIYYNYLPSLFCVFVSNTKRSHLFSYPVSPTFPPSFCVLPSRLRFQTCLHRSSMAFQRRLTHSRHILSRMYSLNSGSDDRLTYHLYRNIDRATLQQAPLPSPYPRPINAYPSSPPLIAPSTSLPTAQTPMHAPQPQHASPPPANSVAFPFQSPARAHIFEPFKLERASPDLQDVLTKKSVGSPGRAVPIKTGASDDAKAKGRSAM